MIQSIKEATAGQFSAPPPPQPQQQQPQPQPQQQQRPDFQEEDFSVVEEEPRTNAIKPDIIIAPKKRGRPKR
jgi:hypothetical protein